MIEASRDIVLYDIQSTDDFNRWLHWVVQRIGRDVEKALQKNFVSLVLGGGYGRGEGGVVLVDNVEQPYNDLDFTLIVEDKKRVPYDALNHISHVYEQEIHIDVDFSRPLTRRDIRRWPFWLMWYDLLNGHIVVCGDDQAVTGNAPAKLTTGPLPLIEATRLMLNRGAGLLWAMRVVRNIEPPPDPDFVRRNYYKSIMAMGDALLIAWDRYSTPYTGRDEKIRRLMQDVTQIEDLNIQHLYDAALSFKFRPDYDPDLTITDQDLQGIADLWGRVFIMVEARRTGMEWDLSSYASWDGLREPEQHGLFNWPRNLVHNHRMGRCSLTYPRERLYRDLPALLGLSGRPDKNWINDSKTFLDIWNKFN